MIRLHRIDADGREHAVLVNPAHIQMVEGNCISLVNGHVWVQESFKEIAAELDRQHRTIDIVKALEDIASRITPN